MTGATPFAALLWKELRENAYKVATGLGVVVLLHLLRQLHDFNQTFAEDLTVWAMAVGGLSAGALAMDAIAGERSRGTLEFLLVRPTTAPRILAAKWLVGAGCLLLLTATFWAMAYATPLTNVALWNGAAVQALQDVSWPAMVYAWYLPLLVVYTVVFAASAATDNPAEAAGVAAIVALAAVLLSMLAHSLAPALDGHGTAVNDLIGVGITGRGEIVRVATRLDAVLGRTVLAAVLVAASLLAAGVIVARFRDFALSRRVLVVAGFALVTLLLTLPRLLPDGETPVLPLATVRIGPAPGADRLELRGRLAYVLKRDSLVIVDVSTPSAPRLASTAALVGVEGASLSHLTFVGDYGCALGVTRHGGEDATEVLCFDVADPQQPRLTGRWALDEGPGVVGVGWFGYGGLPVGNRLQRSGDYLILGTVRHTRSLLFAIGVDGDGRPQLRDTLELETYEYPERTWAGEHVYDRDFFVRRHLFSMAAADGHVFLGMPDGLWVVEVGADGGLSPRGRLDLEDAVEHMVVPPRALQLQGDTVWIDRAWPREKVRVDVSDAARPRVVDVRPSDARQANPLAAGFHYRPYGQGVPLYDPDDLYARAVPTLKLDRQDRRWGTSSVLLRDGFAYALMDDELAVFQLPRRAAAELQR